MYENILAATDHTALKQTVVWEDIKILCSEALRNKTASVCIPPSYVRRAHIYLAGQVEICTVIGFPNGYSTTAIKCLEAQDAVANGASEIDMVINLGWVKEGKYESVLKEINAVKKSCMGKLLKVIVETCLLTQEEKIELCRVVSQSDADYIKTSTGFSTGGATPEDIALFAANMTKNTKIKAAGGIKSIEDAERCLQLGADRLGSSSLVGMVEKEIRD